MGALGKINANLETSTRVREFCTLAQLIAVSRGKPETAIQLADQYRLSTPFLKELLIQQIYSCDRNTRIRKTVTGVGTISDTSWAGPLASYDTLAAAFLASLNNYGAFDRMLPAMKRVPFRVRVGASTSIASGAIVGENNVKPISKLNLTTSQIDELKAVCLLVLTSELMKFGDRAADDLFATQLSSGVAVSTDTQFVTILAAGAPSIASTGITAEGVRNDLRLLLLSVTTNARSQLFILTTSAVAKALSVLHTNAGDQAFPGLTYNGGSISGMPVVVSDGVPANTLLLADAQQICAASETVQLSAASHASVQTDTSPDSPPTASTPLVSLWQMNYDGLRAERYFGAQKLTTTGVAVLTNINYTGDSPGP